MSCLDHQEDVVSWQCPTHCQRAATVTLLPQEQREGQEQTALIGMMNEKLMTQASL